MKEIIELLSKVYNPTEVFFIEEGIQKLLKLKWWNWSEEEVKSAMPLICSNNIEGLLSINADLDKI